MFYVLALLLGVTAGLRAATPLAAVSIGAYLGWLNLSGTWTAFLGTLVAAIILGLIAIAELVGDQLPTAPSRKSPQQFGARVVSGALSGLLVGLPLGSWIGGLVAGAVGAVIGTLGGFEARTRLVAATGGRDLPIALLEDAVTIVLAFLVVHTIG